MGSIRTLKTVPGNYDNCVPFFAILLHNHYNRMKSREIYIRLQNISYICKIEIIN